jgi:dihydroorotate dehydrogenase (fumarate)
MEQAGADALELKVFEVAVDSEESASELEERIVTTVATVAGALRIPVAVKLSPFYTALPHLARRLIAAGARGLVLFNRFYDPDIDVEELALVEHATLSSSSELPLRLRWLGILSAQLDATSFAVTGGVHRPIDAIKALMAGADTVQMVSALLRQGPAFLAEMQRGVESWLEEKEYASLAQLRGSLNLARCPQPDLYRRGNYLRTLQTWPHGAHGWRH